MLKFLQSFVIGFLTVGAVASVMLGGTVGAVAFFYWLSDGALWGLVCSIATIIATIGGVAFAATEV